MTVKQTTLQVILAKAPEPHEDVISQSCLFAEV